MKSPARAPGDEQHAPGHIYSRGEASRLIEEATRKGKVPWDMPDELERRWRSLLEISRACEEARTWGVPPAAQNVAEMLGDRIEAAAVRHTPHLHLVPYLRRMAAAGYADNSRRRNDRSFYHRHVQADPEMNPGIRQSLHSIIDMLYNQVISESLQSAAELTTHAANACEIVKRADTPGSITVGDQGAEDLEGLTWPLLLTLREILEDEELSVEKKRVLFRERCVLDPFKLEDEQGWAFRLMPKIVDAGADIAVGKVVTMIVEGVMPGALTGPGSIIMSLATSVSTSMFVRAGDRLQESTKRRRAHRQERNIVALLDEHLDHRQVDHQMNHKKRTAEAAARAAGAGSAGQA